MRGTPRADTDQQRVSLGEHARVVPAHVRPRRPDGSDDLVDVGSPKGRWPLQELETVGHEDAHEWSGLDVEQALDGGPVGGHPLDRLAAAGQRPEPDAQLMGMRVVEQPHDDACGLRAEAHELAIVARARRSGGAAEVERLQQVGLTHPVRSVDYGEALADRRLGARVGAEVAHLHADDAHGSTSDVETDRHDQVHEVPGVGGFDQPGAQRADELQHELL